RLLQRCDQHPARHDRRRSRSRRRIRRRRRASARAVHRGLLLLPREVDPMAALFSMLYGMAAYVFFLCTFAYAIGFVGGVFVPKGIDGGGPVTLVEALAVNLLLLGIFAVQHSVMAR